ncbi:MAG TPA: DUF3524 domain-containing protein [Acidobacteriota bacterium]|nr:DUF3524 domain-containing protein [Acidobacteriota bacterium]
MQQVSPLRILLVSPYHGGSHQSWAEGLLRNSRHQLQLLTLPARYWKWRMHGGALTLARRCPSGSFDLLVATDMLDLSTFLALQRRRLGHLPCLLYMHENQLTYPLPEDPSTGPMRRQLGERDQHYAFVNLSSMLAADAVWFNSEFHRRSFFEELPGFLRHFPEHRELGRVPRLKRRCRVMPVGVELPEEVPAGKPSPPLIVWNQRWEYDKDPQAFFQALYRLQDSGSDFRLALCGQRFARRPSEFEQARGRLEGRIVHEGFADRRTYRRLLDESSVVLSTACHEFFGISVLEAVGHGAFPVLPDRLSYPELIPREFHRHCLYQDQQGLDRRLKWAVDHPGAALQQAASLAEALRRYDWKQVSRLYDSGFLELRHSRMGAGRRNNEG